MLYLLTCVGGREKATVCWLVLGRLTTMALLLVMPWLARVQCEIGCVLVDGVDALITLVDGTPTVGAGVGALITLGGGASTVGAGVGV